MTPRPRPIPTTTALAPPTVANDNHHHYYPLPSYSSSSSSASLRGCCCYLFLLFSFLALLILAVILVIFLAVKPKKTEFDLQQVGVQYMGISPTMSSAAAVSLTIQMLFTAANNRVGIKYDESRFTVMYCGIPLGWGTIPAFYQLAHTVTQVSMTIIVDWVSLLQADAADLLRDATVNDPVDLRVIGDVGAKIRILGFTLPGVQVLVDCTIAIIPSKQAVISKQCGFDGLSV